MSVGASIAGAVGSIGSGVASFFGAKHEKEKAETQRETQKDWIKFQKHIREQQFIPGVQNWIVYLSVILLIFLAIFLIVKGK